MPARNPLTDLFRRLAKLELPVDSFGEPRSSAYTNFPRLPATAVTAATDLDLIFIIFAAHAATISRAAKTGVTLASAATASGDGVLLTPAATTSNMNLTTSVTSLIRFSTRLNLPALTLLLVSCGLDENITAVEPDGTAGEGAMFVFDPTAAITMAGITAAQQAANWICHYKIGGADVYINSGIAVVAATDYRLEISIDATLKPHFYINGAGVATGAALTTAKTVAAKVGIITKTTAVKSLVCRYVKMSAAIG